MISFLFCYFLVTLGFSQVGIGTDTPTSGYALDVEGSLLIQDVFEVDNLPNVTTESTNFKFLMRKNNSNPPGEVVRLDVEEIAVAPVNIINYKFTNLKTDNVQDVNLQYDASKYVVGMANFRYVGDVIEKGRVGSDYPNLGFFVSRTFVEDGTWHLEIRNRIRDSANNSTITYYVTLIVFDKKYFKELPSIVADLEGASTGAANAPTGL